MPLQRVSGSVYNYGQKCTHQGGGLLELHEGMNIHVQGLLACTYVHSRVREKFTKIVNRRGATNYAYSSCRMYHSTERKKKKNFASHVREMLGGVNSVMKK